jgi:hypothetical protein
MQLKVATLQSKQPYFKSQFLWCTKLQQGSPILICSNVNLALVPSTIVSHHEMSVTRIWHDLSPKFANSEGSECFHSMQTAFILCKRYNSAHFFLCVAHAISDLSKDINSSAMNRRLHNRGKGQTSEDIFNSSWVLIAYVGFMTGILPLFLYRVNGYFASDPRVEGATDVSLLLWCIFITTVHLIEWGSTLVTCPHFFLCLWVSFWHNAFICVFVGGNCESFYGTGFI